MSAYCQGGDDHCRLLAVCVWCCTCEEHCRCKEEPIDLDERRNPTLPEVD